MVSESQIASLKSNSREGFRSVFIILINWGEPGKELDDIGLIICKSYVVQLKNYFEEMAFTVNMTFC